MDEDYAAVGSDFDSKNLNFLEELAVCCKGEIDEDVCLSLNDWLVKPTIASHGIPLNIKGDAKHGLKLARAQILYVDKIIPSPAGPVILQLFEDARKDLQSGLTRHSVDPDDRQDVEEAMAFLSEKARPVLFEISGDLAVAVYTFLSRLIYDVYYGTHLSLSVERRVFLAGVVERSILSWRTWVVDHDMYSLSKNFCSGQFVKFLIL